MTLAEVTEQAEAGNPQAMVSLGHHLYKKGDIEGSVRWLAAAADAGHVPAMAPAAALIASEEHLDGLGLDEKSEAIDRALAWVSQAEDGDVTADLGRQLAELRDNVAEERDKRDSAPVDGGQPGDAGMASQAAEESPVALTCPHCGKPRSETTRFCRFCGQPIPEEAPSEAEGEPTVSEPRRCPNPACGAIVSDDAVFCNTCGQRLETAAEDGVVRLPERGSAQVEVTEESVSAAASDPVSASAAPDESPAAPAVPSVMTGMYGMDSLEHRLKEIEYSLAEAKFEVLKAEREQDYQRQAELKYQVIPGLERERDVLERGMHQPVASAPVAPAMGVPQAMPQGMGMARPKNPGTGCMVFDIAGIILVLLCPWVSANLLYTSKQMSLLELAAKAMDASSTVSSLSSLSGSSSSSSLSSALAGVGVIGGLMALVTVTMLGADIAKDHNVAKCKTGYGSIVLAITGILVWLVITATTSSVSGSGSSDLDAMLSGVASQMIQCTGWVFVSVCVGIASYAYHRSVQKKIDIANGVIPAAPATPAMPAGPMGPVA